MTPHADLVARLREVGAADGCLAGPTFPSATGGTCITRGRAIGCYCRSCLAIAAADAIAALPPPADPPALVALVREYQEAERAWGDNPVEHHEGRSERIERVRAAQAAVLAYPLPAAPPVTDTPQGWQPLETAPVVAPPDQSVRVLGWGPKCGFVFAHYTPFLTYRWTIEGWSGATKLAFWKPLAAPAAPPQEDQ